MSRNEEDVQEQVHETGISSVEIRILGGSVTLGPSDSDVTGAITGPASVRARRGVLRIEARRSVDIELAVPAGCGLDIASRNADVDVTAPVGACWVASGAGDIHVQEAESATLRSGAGDIQVGSIHGRARIRCGSGDVQLDQISHDSEVVTGSGDITVNQLHGYLVARTGSGDTGVSRLTRGGVQARSGSGDVQIGVTEGMPVWLDLRSGSGQVDVGLDQGSEPESGSPYAKVEAVTASGDIQVKRV